MRRLVLGMLVALATGCVVHAYPRGYYYHGVGHHWVFYPDADCYYCSVHGHYWYQDGGSWITVNVPPPHIRLGAAIRLDLTDGEPWHQHDVHLHLPSIHLPAPHLPRVTLPSPGKILKKLPKPHLPGFRD